MLKDWLSEAHDVRGFMQLSTVRIWSYIWAYLKIRTFQEGPKTQKIKELKPRHMELYPSLE